MTNAFQDVIKWVSKLPYWEQASFDLIISAQEITENKLGLLVDFLLSEYDLLENKIEKPEINFQDFIFNQSDCVQYNLKKISNLRNINALINNQSLEFGKNLTAIFGMNGSGKSGYARVLGSAGFTRGDKDIIPNVTQPYDSKSLQLVTIDLECDEKLFSIEYEIGKPCPQLSSFYVFDSTSVNVHITKENTISFSPVGLSYLHKLADITDQVRDKLQNLIDSKDTENRFVALFNNESEIKRIIESLDHTTDIDSIKKISIITDKEEYEIKNIKTKVATIETQGISTKVGLLIKEKEDIKSLLFQLDELSKEVSVSSINEINLSIQDLNNCLQNANRLGLEKFKSHNLNSVGSDEWINFIRTAKILAEKEFEEIENTYPTENSFCLLCQQPLSQEAIDLINNLWKYLESEIQNDITSKINKKKKRLQELMCLDTNIFTDKHSVFRIVQNRNPDLSLIICEDLTKLNTLIQMVSKLLEENQLIEEINYIYSCQSGLQDLIAEIDEEINKWNNAEEELEDYKNNILIYEHKLLLSKYINDIDIFIKNLRWVDKAKNIGGNTSHITRTYNKFFNTYVTDDYIKIFKQTLKELGRPLEVNINTRGSKGEVYKHLELSIHESTPEKLANPDKILSEGEKRAVALADFLTEVTLDISSRGIILDDPVTSLDIEWRQKIAELLVQKAIERQVIVFTHDLPFLYFLCKTAENNNIPIENHWVKKGDIDNIPGYVFLNNSPALEKDYKNRDRAMKCYQESINISPEIQQSVLKEGFGALRTSYEALIIFEVFGGVVMRFEERISFGRLKEVTWDPDIAEEIISKSELCSRYIEGHLHSDTFRAKLPTPEILKQEIDEYDEIKSRLKKKRKSIKTL